MRTVILSHLKINCLDLENNCIKLHRLIIDPDEFYTMSAPADVGDLRKYKEYLVTQTKLVNNLLNRFK